MLRERRKEAAAKRADWERKQREKLTASRNGSSSTGDGPRHDTNADVLGYLLQAAEWEKDIRQQEASQATQTESNLEGKQETEMTDLDSKLNEALEAQNHLVKVINQLKLEKVQRDEKAKADAQEKRVDRMIQLTKAYRHLTPYPFMHVIVKHVRGEQKVRLNLAQTKQQEDFGSSSSSVTMGQPSFDTMEALLEALDKTKRRLDKYEEIYGDIA